MNSDAGEKSDCPHYDIQKVIHKSSPDGYCALVRQSKSQRKSRVSFWRKTLHQKDWEEGIRKKKRRWQ